MGAGGDGALAFSQMMLVASGERCIAMVGRGPVKVSMSKVQRAGSAGSGWAA